MQGPIFFPTVSLLTSPSIHGNMHQLTQLESKEREVLKDSTACMREQNAKQTLVCGSGWKTLLYSKKVKAIEIYFAQNKKQNLKTAF